MKPRVKEETNSNNSIQRRFGAILSYVSLAVNAIGSFIYVPILLSALSVGEYGVYELIGSIIAYLSVMDLGFSTTLSRYYVKEKVQKDVVEVENLLAISAVVYGFITILAVLVGIVFNLSLDTLFGETFTSSELDLSHQMMLLAIVNCVVVFPGSWFLALINANERFVFARSLSIIKYVLQILTVIAILSRWNSAFAVLLIQVVFNALSVIAYVLYTKTKLSVNVKLHYWDGLLLKDMLVYSFFILLGIIYDQLVWRTGQVVLGAVSGATATAVYGIVCKVIASGYIPVSSGITNVFLPKLTAISAKTQDMTEINEIFKRIGHIQAILVWGLCGIFIVVGEQFIVLWAGEAFAQAYPACLMLMMATSVSLVQNLGIYILQAKNKMAFRSVVYIVLAVVNVFVSIPASMFWGVIGCAASTACLIALVTGPIINFYYHIIIKLDILGFFRTVLPVLVPVCISTAFCFAIRTFVFPEVSWFDLIVLIVSYAVVFFALLNLFKHAGFNEYERTLISGMTRRVFGSH